MKILIVVPVYYREEAAFNSIQSILSLTDVGKADVEMVVCNNGSSDDFKKIIKSVMNKYTGKIVLRYFEYEENYGKAYVVNDVASKIPFNYLISIDGDMICVQRNWLTLMINTYIKYKSKASIRLGALCANQIGNNCHLVKRGDKYANSCDIDGQFIVTSGGNSGIAGGVLCTDEQTWIEIGGYDSTKLYGGDDGYFADECNKRHYIMGYLDGVNFYHPYDFNTGYSEWKQQMIKKIHNGEPDTTYVEGFFG